MGEHIARERHYKQDSKNRNKRFITRKEFGTILYQAPVYHTLKNFCMSMAHFSLDVYTSYLDVPVSALAWSPDDTRFVTSIVVSTQGLPLGGAGMYPQDGSFAQISQA